MGVSVGALVGLPAVTLFGHDDASTTMIDTHVLSKGGLGIRSPRDG